MSQAETTTDLHLNLHLPALPAPVRMILETARRRLLACAEAGQLRPHVSTTLGSIARLLDAEETLSGDPLLLKLLGTP